MEESGNVKSAKVETVINAEIQEVWKCLVNETNQWWSKDFYTNSKTKGYHIDARIGGMAYEDFGDGEGLVWSEVIGVDSPSSIQFKGLLSPDFGGPAISFMSIHLISDGAQTNFKLTDTLFGAVSKATASQIEAGWQMIYAKTFKGYVENKVNA